jgi:hypothetical protein
VTAVLRLKQVASPSLLGCSLRVLAALLLLALLYLAQWALIQQTVE